jgi:hypothetical protein
MLNRFTDHPASVGETYLEHMGQAGSFGVGLIGAGLACLVHAVFPFLFVKTGSQAITSLYGRMVMHRDRRAPRAMDAAAETAR